MPTFEVETDTDIYDVEADTAEEAQAIVEAQLSGGGTAEPEAAAWEGPTTQAGKDFMSQAGDIMKGFEGGPDPYQSDADRFEAANSATVMGAPIIGPWIQVASNAARAAGRSMTGDKGFGEEFDNLADEQRRARMFNRDLEQRGTVAGQIAGSVGIAAKAPAAFGQAAGQGMKAQIGLGMASNAALTGADVLSRGGSVEDAAIEGGISGALGGAAPIIATGVRGIGQGLGSIWRAGEGYFRPSQAANRRIAAAISDDAASGRVMSPGEYGSMTADGQPVLNVDMFGDAVRSEAGAAVKGSGVSANLADETVGARHLGQSTRSVKTVEDLVGGPVNRTEVKANIRSAGRAANKGVYERAMMMPHAQDVWSDRLADLSSRPSMKRAMARAEETSREAGGKVRSPFTVGANGELTPVEGVRPTLEFWDQVYKNLSDEVDGAWQQGKNAKSQLSDTKNAFREELDSLVPEYKEARGVANEFFKAGDAVEAGENLFKGNYSNLEEVARNAARFNSAEREGLKVGFAGALIEKLEGKTDTLELTNMLRSPAMRKKMLAAFGEEGADKIESMVATEVLFSAAKKATQARGNYNSLIGYGVGAGTGASLSGGYSLSQGNIGNAITYASMGALAGAAYKKSLKNVAEEIGKKLLSNDPNAIKEAVKIAARSKENRDLMLRMTGLLSRGIAATGTTVGDRANQ